MKLPEIYGDFHKLDDENRICLTTVGRVDAGVEGLVMLE